MSTQRNTINLLDVEPDLAEGLNPQERAAAARVLAVPSHVLEPGPWDPERELGDIYPVVGFLIVDGMVTRDLLFAGRTTTELPGRGRHPAPVGRRHRLRRSALLGQLERAHRGARGDPRHAGGHRRRALALAGDRAARPTRAPRARPGLPARDRPAAAGRRPHDRPAVGARRALGPRRPRRRARAGRAAPSHPGHAGRGAAPIGHDRADGPGARGARRAHRGRLAAARRRRRGARRSACWAPTRATSPWRRATTRSRGRRRGRRRAGAW